MNIDAWFLFEAGINLYQSALITYFVRQRFHVTNTRFFFSAICVAAIWIYLTLCLFVDVPTADTFVILIPFAYTFLISDDKWYVKLFWNAVLSLTLSSVVNLVINLFIQFTNSTITQIMSETPLRVLFVVSCNIALLFVVFLETRIGKKSMGALSLASMIIFLATLILELVVVELLYTIRVHTQVRDIPFTAVSICMLGCSVLSLVLYELMSTIAIKQKNVEAELEIAKLSQHHYEEIKDMYSYMVSRDHEIKHQMCLIHKLLDDGHLEAGESLLKEQKNLHEISYEFITGCVAMDALLTVKKLAMDRNKVHFEFQPYPLHELPIAESKFCAIISNILDNAIEGTLRINDKTRTHTITLKFARSWDIFFIICENDMNPSSIRMNGNHFLSSKPNSSRHGFGTQNIKSIVNEANGQCKFIPNTSTFRVEITLPYGFGDS